jgi:hypothetical protein
MEAALKKADVGLGAYFISGFVQYFVPTVYLVWALGVLKYSSGANKVDARELLIYSFSLVGVVVTVTALRKKFIKRIEGTG